MIPTRYKFPKISMKLMVFYLLNWYKSFFKFIRSSYKLAHTEATVLINGSKLMQNFLSYETMLKFTSLNTNIQLKSVPPVMCMVTPIVHVHPFLWL